MAQGEVGQHRPFHLKVLDPNPVELAVYLQANIKQVLHFSPASGVQTYFLLTLGKISSVEAYV